jgi:single-stranded-DNA-specific exonuclease
VRARPAASRPVRRRLRPARGEGARRLEIALGIPGAAARALAARGFADPASAAEFLAPSPERLHDPFSMAGLPAAVERLAATARRRGRVVVFGDYDCDGIGALAILTTVLSRLGADARSFIPDRVADGYGLRSETLARALDEHEPEGLVTVDCGITAVAPVAEATRRGTYVVITDHHLPKAALPDGAILVDPKLPGCAYPFTDLCGAGLAWKLAEGLLKEAGAAAGLSPEARRSWLASCAKIAALSTVADVVPLAGENRVLVAWGLAGLAEPRAPGVAALLKRAGIPAGRGPTAREVAFRVAPRLNAMGRVSHARRALELLTTADAVRAETLAGELEAANVERRSMQARLVSQVLARLEAGFDPDRDAVVVEAGDAADGWHRGVLGIAATRVAEEVRRPVLLFSRDGEVLSGSGRTFGSTPLHERVAPVAARFASEFGGHAAALGVTLPARHWHEFREALAEAFAAGRNDAEWETEIVADTEALPEEMTAELARALRLFEPAGAGNPRPLLLVRGLTWDGRGRPVGERGLRTFFSAGASRLDAVGWSLAALPPGERPGVADVAAHLEIDAFTGRPTLEVVDVAPADSR